MVANGLLLLTSSTRSILSSSRLKYNLIAASNKLAAGILYVYSGFSPGSNSPTFAGATSPPQQQQHHVDDYYNPISRHTLTSSRVYSQGQQICPRLDIRFLYEKSLENNARPSAPIDMVLVEMQGGAVINKSLVRNFVTQHFRVTSSDFEIHFIDSEKEGEGSEVDVSPTSEANQVPFSNELFNKVVIGGTFDRMHVAHKILITEAALRCSNELIIGITDDNMIKSKFSCHNHG